METITLRLPPTDQEMKVWREKWDAKIKREKQKERDKKYPELAQKTEAITVKHATSEEISDALRTLVSSTKKNAAARKIDFNIRVEDLVRRANEHGWRCEVTGIPFDHAQREGWSRRPYAASIDRIDNNEGYTPINVRLVCAAVNLAMNEWGDEVFDRIAREYVKNRPTD